MNTLKRSFGLVALLMLMNACAGTKPFTKKDLRSAQKVIGLNFSEQAFDTMYTYLQRNRSGYDSLREHTLDYRVAPPLYFDPRPDGFVTPLQETPWRWPLPPSVQMPANTDELAFYTVEQLGELIRTRQLTSEALTRLYLDRMKRYDPDLRAVITILEERALEQARTLDAELAAGIYRGPLHGIPYGTKDLMAVEGYPTTWGAVPYQHQQLEHTATVIQKLDEAGAVLLAKLSSGALARGDVWFGAKTRNPWDTKQGASGSSAGSGSATAAGLVAFSLGTETLGSIVSPATRCGVTGLRPTYGRVSREGVMALSWTMDKVGPICRSAFDCALVLNAIRGADGKDRTVVDAAFSYQARQELSGLKIGYLHHLFAQDSSDIGSNNEQALQVFRTLGARLDTVQLPEDFPFEVFDIILRAEAGAFFDELVLSEGVNEMVEQGRRSRANSLRQSRFIPAVEYLQANRQRKVLIEALHQRFQEYDIILTPTFAGRQLLITNLSGHPAISLPTGLDKDGHPTSITILANLYEEDKLLSAAAAFQQASEWDELHPPAFK